MFVYGQAPGPWFDWEEVPTDKLGKYIHMMSQLDAERSLAMVSSTAAGSGTMEERAQRQYLSTLRRAATGTRGVEKATVASLAAMRIPIETIPPKEESK